MSNARGFGAGFSALAVVAAMVLVVTLTASADVGDTIRVSVNETGDEGNGFSGQPSISADGRYVAFESEANNLVDDDTNNAKDVFVHDLSNRTISLISSHTDGTQGDSGSFGPSISADGRYVAFGSNAANLVDNDSNGTLDVFVHDVEQGTTTLVSSHSDGTQGNAPSSNPAISADGSVVAFDSAASNLIDHDNNGDSFDVFVHDRQTGETTTVSVDSNGTQGDDGSYGPAISGDGRYVAFYSNATNLIDDDSNLIRDVFVHDRQTGETTLVSVDSNGTQGNELSDMPSISADGRYIAFYSVATNLIDDAVNDSGHIFVRDRQSGETTLVSVDSNGNQGNGASIDPSISAGGRYVAFFSYANNLADDDTNFVTDVFVHDRHEETTTRVSIDSNGTEGNAVSLGASISGDGRHLVFNSYADNLVDGDTNGQSDVFAHQYLEDPPPPTTTTTTTTSTSTSTSTTVPEDPDFFSDDDGHLFEDDINAIAEEGITVGCNPPENTHFCPDESFLRGQAAAFVRRALDVPASEADHFTDDDNSVFEGDIDAIAEEGITIGCNPPDNTMFCPTEQFTRGQAAAFLRRALDVLATTTDHFADDDGHLFEDDINAIAEAGLTIGCNPPDNTYYCPDDLLTRGQAAAFMRRALID